MPGYYINMNLRVADRDPAVLARHLEGAVSPELGFDPVLLDAKPRSWHEALARELDAAGLSCTVHLPFFDLQPGSIDPRIRAASRDRLRSALEIAAIYAPDRLVGHAAYDRFLYRRSFDAWAERAADTWAEALSFWTGHPPLCLENTHETDPATLAGAVAVLRRRDPAVGACFDVGHWFSFAGGCRNDNLAVWIETLAPCLLHLHLHDNDGSFDQHLGPGQGGIPFDTLFTLLADADLCPSVTFEPHTPEAFAQAMAFAKDKAGILGFKACDARGETL